MTNKETPKVESIYEILEIIKNQIDDITTTSKLKGKVSNFSQGELKGLLMVKDLLEQIEDKSLEDTYDIMDGGLNDLDTSMIGDL